jgi:hypothetical protein
MARATTSPSGSARIRSPSGALTVSENSGRGDGPVDAVKIQPSNVTCCQSPAVRRTVTVAPACNAPSLVPFAWEWNEVSAWIFRVED